MASTGGHLAQLIHLADRIALRGERLWVTFDTPQSRGLLSDQDVVFVPFTRPRDAWTILRNVGAARKLFHQHDVVEVVSTGAGIALSFLPLARSLGIDSHYFESAARTEGPSVTGRVLQWVPGVDLYTQYARWATARWRLTESVMSDFVPGPPSRLAGGQVRIVVTLGTLPYRFDRLVEAVRAATQPDWRVLWQVGDNPYADLPGQVVAFLSPSELARECAAADVVIGHGGVGSAMTALAAGKHPILVPRSPEFREHVDEHQGLVCQELVERGVATVARPADISTALIEHVAKLTVERRPSPVPLTRGAAASAR